MKQIILYITVLFFIHTASFSQTNKRIYKKFTDTTFKSGDIILCPKIVFVLGKGDVVPESKDSVKIIADFINNHKKFIVEIGVHIDNRGKKEFQTKVTDSRAKAVLEYLKQFFFIASDNIRTKGYGSSDMIINDAALNRVSNKSEEGRMERDKLHLINRRVELKIIKTE